MPRNPNAAMAKKAAKPRISKFAEGSAEHSAELTDQLIRQLIPAPGQAKPEGVSNQRNGTRAKKVLTDSGQISIAMPRDREVSFEPQRIGKHERRLTGVVQFHSDK